MNNNQFTDIIRKYNTLESRLNDYEKNTDHM